MAKPWDIKLTHELTEYEMRDFVYSMEYDGSPVDRIECVNDLVQESVDAWKAMQGQYGAHPVTSLLFYPPMQNSGFISELSAMPYSPEPLRTITIKVYPWMQEKHVRYLARMQIEEQL